jgi:hypothetical protein
MCCKSCTVLSCKCSVSLSNTRAQNSKNTSFVEDQAFAHRRSPLGCHPVTPQVRDPCSRSATSHTSQLACLCIAFPTRRLTSGIEAYNIVECEASSHCAHVREPLERVQASTVGGAPLVFSFSSPYVSRFTAQLELPCQLPAFWVWHFASGILRLPSASCIFYSASFILYPAPFIHNAPTLALS